MKQHSGIIVSKYLLGVTTVFLVCLMGVCESSLDEGRPYRADCEAEWASERLITVWDKDSSVISGPSHSYRHKHINPTLLREQWHQASYFNTPHCVWRASLSPGIYLLVLIHTYSIVCSISPVLFVRGGLGSVRSVQTSCESLDCLIVELRASLEMLIRCVIWNVHYTRELRHLFVCLYKYLFTHFCAILVSLIHYYSFYI